jgi:hypothetical protein
MRAQQIAPMAPEPSDAEAAAIVLGQLPAPEQQPKESVAGSDADAAGDSANSPAPAASAPAAPQSYKLTGEGVAGLLALGVERWRPDFPLDSDERRELAEDLARVIPKHLGDAAGEYEPEIKLGLTALGIVFRRWMRPKKEGDGRRDNAGAGSHGRGQDVRHIESPPPSSD